MFFDEKLTELAAMMTISTTMAHATGFERRSSSTKKQISPIVSMTVWTKSELDDGGDPEVFDAVIEAELRLQRIHPNRVRTEDQFMPIEMREQVEGGEARQRTSFVGREAQQHLVENAQVEGCEYDGACSKQHAVYGENGRGQRHSLSPHQANRLEQPDQPDHRQHGDQRRPAAKGHQRSQAECDQRQPHQQRRTNCRTKHQRQHVGAHDAGCRQRVAEQRGRAPLPHHHDITER